MHDVLDVAKALADGELCVCQIVELLQLAPLTVSKHRSILRQARLVEGRKDGRWMYYRLPETLSYGFETASRNHPRRYRI